MTRTANALMLSGPDRRYRPRRWSPKEDLSRLVLPGIANASKAPLTVTTLMQASEKGGKIGQVSGRDGGCARQMLQTVGPDGPHRAAPHDRTDAGLLRAREHGAGYRSRTCRVGPAGRFCTRTVARGLRLARGPPASFITGQLPMRTDRPPAVNASRLGLVGPQVDSKDRTPHWIVFDQEPAAVGVHDRPTDRQPHAQPVRSRGEERLEDPIEVGLGDALARVVHAEFGVGWGRNARPHGDRPIRTSSVSGGGDGVCEQV